MRDGIGLFRGKPKNKGDYYFFSQNWKESCKDGFAYGSLVVAHGRYYICVSALCKVNCCVNNSLGSMIEVIPETVGEYTGLEKNGTKIFEGDIICIHISEYSRGEYDVFGEIKFGKYDTVYQSGILGFWIDWGFNRNLACMCERSLIKVVGNIHDNPELLKGGANNENA
jgi:uncharacterized phage protein (TIGR01671 family)